MNQFTEFIQNHRSIRKYKSDPIPEDILKDIITCGIRSSTAGNMQSWSVIVTKDQSQKEKLYEAHGHQTMILEAPVVLTFCSDFHRMINWLKAHDSKISFDDFLGFLTGAVDAVIGAQSIALAAEAHGLGICYMGTTLWQADTISEILETPDYVIPVTSLVMGYPNEKVEQKDRLSYESVVFNEKYRSFNKEETLEMYSEKEARSMKRYKEFPGLLEKMKELGITKPSDFYTSEIKYSKGLHSKVSRMLIEFLKQKKFDHY